MRHEGPAEWTMGEALTEPRQQTWKLRAPKHEAVVPVTRATEWLKKILSLFTPSVRLRTRWKRCRQMFAVMPALQSTHTHISAAP